MFFQSAIHVRDHDDQIARKVNFSLIPRTIFSRDLSGGFFVLYLFRPSPLSRLWNTPVCSPLPKAERHHLEEAVQETIKTLSPEGDMSGGHRPSATADDLQVWVEHGLFAVRLFYRLLKQSICNTTVSLLKTNISAKLLYLSFSKKQLICGTPCLSSPTKQHTWYLLTTVYFFVNNTLAILLVCRLMKNNLLALLPFWPSPEKKRVRSTIYLMSPNNKQHICNTACLSSPKKQPVRSTAFWPSPKKQSIRNTAFWSSPKKKLFAALLMNGHLITNNIFAILLAHCLPPKKQKTAVLHIFCPLQNNTSRIRICSILISKQHLCNITRPSSP